jgi:hypothetical protein
LVTAVCPPTTQIESTVRPIANVHPPTVLGGQWPGDTGTYDLQGTRSVDFDEKRRLLLELSFLTGHPLREIDRDGATKCPTGTPTLEKAVACLEPCLSFYAVGTGCWVRFDCTNIDGCQRGYLAWLHRILQKRSEDTRDRRIARL